MFLDERDAIQKKTFTKWVNKHLKKVSHITLVPIVYYFTICIVISIIIYNVNTNNYWMVVNTNNHVNVIIT